jgi:hypothetical protein
MTKSFYDPNPGISILDEPGLKKQIANQAQHALEIADRLKSAPPPTREQWEREQFQAASNRLAEENPFYAGARGSTQFLVLPLEPNGVKPMVPLEEATRDDRQLYAWWSSPEFKDCNPGIRLGRVGGVFALGIETNAALTRLREMASFEEEDWKGNRHIAYREIGGAAVRLFVPSEPFTTRTTGPAWGRQFDKALMERIKEDRQRQIQSCWIVYSYPTPFSGMDAFDYRSKTIGPGLFVVGEGDVLPWNGAILDGDVTVAAPASTIPEAPLWLAKILGRPRSRRVMAAAKEQHEATIKAINAHWLGITAAQLAAGDRAREEAVAELERATKALAEAEK